jgi:hypothetical protein
MKRAPTLNKTVCMPPPQKRVAKLTLLLNFSKSQLHLRHEQLILMFGLQVGFQCGDARARNCFSQTLKYILLLQTVFRTLNTGNQTPGVRGNILIMKYWHLTTLGTLAKIAGDTISLSVGKKKERKKKELSHLFVTEMGGQNCRGVRERVPEPKLYMFLT